MTLSPSVQLSNLNGPVPIIEPAPPWAYGIWVTSVTVLSAPPAWRAVGLLIVNRVSVCDSRKLDTGDFSVTVKVVGSGASVDAMLDRSP